MPSSKKSKVRLIPDRTTSPFEITGEHVASLEQHALLRRLLNVEAHANNLPRDGIHVSSNVNAPDGGEDGRINWEGGPDRTPWLPSRLCQFQLKRGPIRLDAARREVVTRGKVKPMVRSALEDGGHYRLLCAHPYVQERIQEYEAAIRSALRGAGLAIDDRQVSFRDANQIASWVNCHPSVATWVKEQTQPVGPFRSWGNWAGRAENIRSPWVDDQRFPGLCARLRQMAEPREFLRLIGLSGIGKSRLVLEALRPSDGDEAGDYSLSDLVMYAVESEMGARPIKEVVHRLADSGAQAIVVVDRCDPGTRHILESMVLHESSRLSLITIDNDILAGPLDDKTMKIDEAPFSVVEEIVRKAVPSIRFEERRRIAYFSGGFPGLAVGIGQAWSDGSSILQATDKELVDAFILGHSPRERDLLLKSAALLAAFGPASVEPSSEGQLIEIASHGRHISDEDLCAVISDLVDRDIAQRRGRFVVLRPRPIAMKLAERQWKEWSKGKWVEVLSGGTSPALKRGAARQLALLNTSAIADEVVRYTCRPGGLFDSLNGLCKDGHAEVLSSLSEIDPQVVVAQIRRCLGMAEDLSQVPAEARYHLIHAVEKIAFHADTFEDGARLLLHLARAWSGTEGNHVAGKFKALFSPIMGNTAADGDARLAILEEAAHTDSPIQRGIVVGALLASLADRPIWHMAGAEAQGTRPALNLWQPTSKEEEAQYINGCVDLLVEFAMQQDELGSAAFAGLGEAFYPLILEGYIDTVEDVVKKVPTGIVGWPEAMESLGKVLTYCTEHTGPKTAERVRRLVDVLHSEDLHAKVRFLVTEMPFEYPFDQTLDYETRIQRQIDTVNELAVDLLKEPKTLNESLPQLSRGKQQMADVLGAAVAKTTKSPLDWLEPITRAFLETSEGERNSNLLSGFLIALADDYLWAVDQFKERAADSRELAPVLPLICSGIGIAERDIRLIVQALRDELLSPGRLHVWRSGGALAQIPSWVVAPLLDAMLDHSAEGFAEAIELLLAYVQDNPEAFDELRPQVLTLVENVNRWQPALRWGEHCEYSFERIMNRMLGKGRQSEDATAVAAALAEALINAPMSSERFLLRRVVPSLLSNFADVTWPHIGQAIVSDPGRALALKHRLGAPRSIGQGDKPMLLSLPEPVLLDWCRAHSDHAPAFVAEIVPLLTPPLANSDQQSLHPIVATLLDEFGERTDVQRAVELSMSPSNWLGSLATYYAPYREPMIQLTDHAKPGVRRWARSVVRKLDDAIEKARRQEEELKARHGIW